MTDEVAEGVNRNLAPTDAAVLTHIVTSIRFRCASSVFGRRSSRTPLR